MKHSIIAFAVIFFMLYGFSSCLNDKADDLQNFCDTTYYAREVKPIFQSNCAISGCHVSGGAAPFTFTSYSVVFTKKDAMKYRINLPSSHQDHMPQGAVLPFYQLSILNTWLDNGATGCD